MVRRHTRRAFAQFSAMFQSLLRRLARARPRLPSTCTYLASCASRPLSGRAVESRSAARVPWTPGRQVASSNPIAATSRRSDGRGAPAVRRSPGHGESCRTARSRRQPPAGGSSAPALRSRAAQPRARTSRPPPRTPGSPRPGDPRHGCAPVPGRGSRARSQQGNGEPGAGSARSAEAAVPGPGPRTRGGGRAATAGCGRLRPAGSTSGRRRSGLRADRPARSGPGRRRRRRTPACADGRSRRLR